MTEKDRQPPRLSAVAELRAHVLASAREYYFNRDVLETRVPTLVDATGACENVDTLFSVATNPLQEGTSAQSTYMTQTGQLALETFLTEVTACWCHTASYRNDFPDSRHLQEFELIEGEFAWNHQTIADGLAYSPELLFDNLLTDIQSLIHHLISAVPLQLVHRLAGTTKHLEAASADIPRVDYSEAIQVANAMRRERNLDQIAWGDDLSAVDEAETVHVASSHDAFRPVLITRYPAKIKFFNMKLDPQDSDRVLSADLILPGAGEALGAAVREDHYPTLVHRLETSRMIAILSERDNTDVSVFLPYLQLIRDQKTQPHAGYGMGLERFLQFLIQSTDIRDVSLPYRLRNPIIPTTLAPVR